MTTPLTPEPQFAIPDRVAFDAQGYGWRVFDGDDGVTEPTWSMVPVNPDNSPIPQPCTFFVPDDLLRAALNENDQEKQMLMAELDALRPIVDDLAKKAESFEDEDGYCICCLKSLHEGHAESCAVGLAVALEARSTR